MKADAIYVVRRPDGAISEASASFSEESCKAKYIAEWLPAEVCDHMGVYKNDVVWGAFRDAGYSTLKIKVPDNEDSYVCHV